MSRFIRLALLSGLFMALLIQSHTPTAVAQEDTAPPIQKVEDIISVCTPDLPHGNSSAVYRICTPPWWWPVHYNELIIWAHGYVDVTRPVEIPEDQLCLFGPVCINDIVNFMGYDFITTSYAVNGLAVVPGVQDIVELVDLYTAEHGTPDRVYIIGASEGGLITTLAIEQNPNVFSGGLPICGPIGDFVGQINYFGDFRVVFDYFFPDLIPGDPTNIPPELMADWDNYYNTTVLPVITNPANRSKIRQLVNVTDIPYLSSNKNTLWTSIGDVLWYNIFATNDAAEVLGGQPFDNMNRSYTGSDNDAALNAGVQRIAADPAALTEINAHYQTSGVLSLPLITMHTTLDQQVPYWHELLYIDKTTASGAYGTYHINYPPTVGYGHCMVDILDVLDAFDLLVSMAGGQNPENLEQLKGLLLQLSLEDRTLNIGH